MDIRPAEDGSGVGAALIAALTLKRICEGNWAGIRDAETIAKHMKLEVKGGGQDGMAS